MEKTVQIPEGVQIEVRDLSVSVKGTKGELSRDFFSPLFVRWIKIEKQDNVLKVRTENEKRKIKAEVGTIAAHVNNMIKGLLEGFTYRLKIVYLHFPMTVKVSGDEVIITNFLGEKSPRRARIIGDTKVDVKSDIITVTGISKEDAGQTAANIERATWVSSRDRRVFQDGCFIIEKP